MKGIKRVGTKAIRVNDNYMRLLMPAAMKAAVAERAWELRLSASAYVRGLIEADLKKRREEASHRQ